MLRTLFYALGISSGILLLFRIIVIVPYNQLLVLEDRIDGVSRTPLHSGYHLIPSVVIPHKIKLHFFETNTITLDTQLLHGIRYTQHIPDTLIPLYTTTINMRLKFILDKKNSHRIVGLLNRYHQSDMRSYVIFRIQHDLKRYIDQFYNARYPLSSFRGSLQRYIENKEGLSNTWKRSIGLDTIMLLEVEILSLHIPKSNIYKQQQTYVKMVIQEYNKENIQNLRHQASLNRLKEQQELEEQFLDYKSSLVQKNPNMIDYLKYQQNIPNTSTLPIKEDEKVIVAPIHNPTIKTSQ